VEAIGDEDVRGWGAEEDIWAEDVRGWGAEEDIWAEDGGNNSRLEKTA
jgi:hypothetical protein